MWFNVNDRWCINMNEVQYFGVPIDESMGIAVMFKNANEKTYFNVENGKRMKVFNEMCNFVADPPAYYYPQQRRVVAPWLGLKPLS